MIRVGLTGGLASGKSYVSRIFEQLGCHVVRADDLGRVVMQKGGEAYSPIIQHFGTDVLGAAGEIDRPKLAALVFADPEKLEQLNALVHPAVVAREEAFLNHAAENDPSGIGIVEAAILIETGSYRRFDKLVLVVCTPEQQVERAMQRNGYTRAEAMARIARQMPVEEKRRFADYVIDTSGSEEQTVEQTEEVYSSLRCSKR